MRNWSCGWLPAVYQGTPFRAGGHAGAQPRDARGVTPEARDGQLRFLDELNRGHLGRHPGNAELEARIANFEIAARMQTAVPEVLDLASEPESAGGCTASTTPPAASTAPAACWPAGWSSAACGSCRSS